MDPKIYFRLKSRYSGEKNKSVFLGDIAQVISEGIPQDKLIRLVVCRLSEKDKTVRVIDAIQIVSQIQSVYPKADIQVIGPVQTVIYLKGKNKRFLKPFLFFLVWMLLYIGAALTIMNFHEDVSMRPVHIKINEIITGERSEYPLWLQVPYSIGLGLGMILFFNHVFEKKINEEPTPLEVEMFNYEENMDRYISVHENEFWKDTNDK